MYQHCFRCFTHINSVILHMVPQGGTVNDSLEYTMSWGQKDFLMVPVAATQIRYLLLTPQTLTVGCWEVGKETPRISGQMRAEAYLWLWEWTQLKCLQGVQSRWTVLGVSLVPGWQHTLSPTPRSCGLLCWLLTSRADSRAWPGRESTCTQAECQLAASIGAKQFVMKNPPEVCIRLWF